MENNFLDYIAFNSEIDKKATQLAASIIQYQSAIVGTAAQYCVLPHWFDQDIIHALLPQLTNEEQLTIEEVFAPLVALPFIDHLGADAAYNAADRTGLLEFYASTQPDLLIKAAKVMAPLYAAKGTYGPAAGEAFFCSIVANETSAALSLLDKLLNEAICREDWYYITGLLQLYDEARQLPFVQTFPLSERQWVLRGLAHRAQGDLGQAINDYLQAIACNSSNILTCMALGAAYIEQQRYEEALKAYDAALEIDPTYVQAYINKGIVYVRASKETFSEKALVCFEDALRLRPDNRDAQLYRQQVLDSPRPKKSGSLLSVNTVHTHSAYHIPSLYSRLFKHRKQLLTLFIIENILVIFWSISYSIISYKRENFLVQIWILVLHIWNYITLTASINLLLWITILIVVAILGFLLGGRIATTVNILKKSDNERELFLWAASQPALNNQINKRQIALIRETRYQHIKKGVIRLAQ